MLDGRQPRLPQRRRQVARVLRRPEVAEDVASIWEYIADDNMAAADRWINQINERLQLLATQPLMGHAREELMQAPDCSRPCAT